MLTIVTELLKDFKVPLALVFAAIVILVFLHQWAEINFVTTAQAESNISDLTAKINANGDKIDANGALIEGLQSTIDVNAIRQDIRDNRNQQYSLSVQIEQSGETSLARKRRIELDNALADLEKAERCMTNGNSNCQ